MYLHKSHFSSYSHLQVWGNAQKGNLFLCADKDVPISSVFWNRPCSYANSRWKGVFKSPLCWAVIYLTLQQFWQKNNFEAFEGIEICNTDFHLCVLLCIIRLRLSDQWSYRYESLKMKRKSVYIQVYCYMWKKRHHITTVCRRHLRPQNL